MRKEDLINKVYEILNESSKKGLWANIHAKRKRGEAPAKPGDEDYPDKKSWNKASKSESHEAEGASYKVDLDNISSLSDEINKMIDAGEDLPSWIQDKITIANHNMDAILGYFDSKNIDEESKSESEELSEEEYEEACSMMERLSFVSEGDNHKFHEIDAPELNESEYRGRKVKLGKIMRGDVKKFKVYVKNDKGNVVKVNFGQKGVKIKKNNPERRKSFRARHNCENPGPRWKARYWSCKKW